MMKVKLYTPDSTRTFEAESLLFPGSQAPFSVLPGHAPIISTLDAGVISWRSGGKEESLKIMSGVVRLSDDSMEICAEL